MKEAAQSILHRRGPTMSEHRVNKIVSPCLDTEPPIQHSMKRGGRSVAIVTHTSGLGVQAPRKQASRTHPPCVRPTKASAILDSP